MSLRALFLVAALLIAADFASAQRKVAKKGIDFNSKTVVTVEKSNVKGKVKVTKELSDKDSVIQELKSEVETGYALRQTETVDDIVVFGPPPPTPFVKRTGTELTVDGKKWTCAGISAPWISTMEVMPERLAADFFKVHRAAGATCIRIFAFANGANAKAGTRYPLMDTVNSPTGFFNELAFRHLDRVLLEAGRAGMRMILTLGNGYEYQGGARWYIEEVLGKNKSMYEFYSNPKVIDAYKFWLNKIITRTNYYTGVKYSDDPTIFTWEVVNEPHLGDDYESKWLDGVKPGTTITNWYSQISDYIKKLDENHLIATGEEGYRADQKVKWGCCMEPSGEPIDPDYWWIDTGLKGVDYKALAELPNIDISTLHIIPEVWNVKPTNIGEWLDKFVSSRSNITRSAGKAMYIGEFGMTSKFMPLDKFTELFRSVCAKYNMDGCLMWPQLRIGQTDAVNANQELYNGDAGEPLKALYKDFNDKSEYTVVYDEAGLGAAKAGCVCKDVRPPGSYGPCDQQVHYPDGAKEGGKCSNSQFDKYCLKSCLKCECSV